MRPINLLLVAIACAFTLNGIPTCIALADSQAAPITITALPAVVDIGGQSGQEIPFSFQLTNSEDTVLQLHITARDSRTRDGQTDTSMSARSAKDWVVLGENDFILVGGESREVQAVLRVPENTSGGYYADIIVQPQSLEEVSSTIGTRPEIAVQLLATIGGEIHEELEVMTQGPASILIGRQSSSTLSFLVQNKGASHTLFTPKLELWNKKHSLTVDSLPEILLPGEQKVIVFTLPQTIQLRMYTAQVHFAYGAPTKDAVGPEIQLIILPFPPLFLLLLLLLPLGIALYYYRHRVQKAAAALIAKNNEI